jgi:hypothetical protein
LNRSHSRRHLSQSGSAAPAAAAAAHHEPGRDYDGAVAEGLIDRIGAEIDRRVDARLGASSRGPRPPAGIAQVRREAMWVGAGVGAGVTGIVAMLASHGSNPSDVIPWVIAIWVILAVAGLGRTLIRQYRERG